MENGFRVEHAMTLVVMDSVSRYAMTVGGNGFRVKHGMTLVENGFRVKHGMTVDVK